MALHILKSYCNINMNSNKTKIIYIAHSSGLQGAGFALLNIIKGIAPYSIEPIVVVPSKGELYYKLLNLGVRCFSINCYNATFPRNGSFRNICLYIPRLIRTKIVNAIAFLKFSKIVVREKPDAVHTNTGVIRYGSRVANKYHIPHFWHIREYQADNSDYQPFGGAEKLLQLFHEPNNHCIAITKALFEKFGLNNNKDIYIYDGVFSENFESMSGISTKKYFLFCGALIRSKGVYEIIDAFNNICNDIPDYELWLAGMDTENVQNYLKTNNFSTRIKILGFRNDVYSLMANSTALIVPSLNEGFGFISVEAMLNKTLVIGKNTAGIKEQFDNGLELCGKEIGFRYMSQKELEDLMILLTREDRTLHTAMLERANSTVRNFYTIETNIKQLVNFYKKILNTK